MRDKELCQSYQQGSRAHLPPVPAKTRAVGLSPSLDRFSEFTYSIDQYFKSKEFQKKIRKNNRKALGIMLHFFCIYPLIWSI